MASDPLKIFVAMPGTDMGSAARWQNPDRIKARFYEAIGKKLEEHLQRKVDLVVEKDREQSGVIYKSMFSAAIDADVYINVVDNGIKATVQKILGDIGRILTRPH